jgi:hypothetical protein
VPADIARHPEPFIFHKIPVMGLLPIRERVRAAGAEYDREISIHEDVDFAFQLYKAGFATAQFNRFAMKVPPGLTNYTHPAYRANSERMVAKWPGWCRLVPNPKTYADSENIPAENHVMLKGAITLGKDISAFDNICCYGHQLRLENRVQFRT